MKSTSLTLLIVAAALAVLLAAPGRVRADETEEAYALNQDAMVDMSTAQFESAAEKFLDAAHMVPDYGIKNRPLRYTPTFMAAWAYEKLGNTTNACKYFKKFLEITSSEDREETKANHAQSYMKGHCGGFPSDDDYVF